jgi:hypothetical protein
MPTFVLWIIVIAVGIPVAAGVLGQVAKRWIELKEKQLEHAAVLAADRAAAQANHIERLESRVRVLERIATDRGVDLAAQIDALADNRLN